MLKRPGEVAARPQNESCSTLKWSSTGQQPPLTRSHTNTRQNAVLQTLSEIHWKGSAPKRKADVLLYPRCGAGCAWRNTHANCHWLVLLTLEGDWALGRDPISQSHWRYVERDWLIGNTWVWVPWNMNKKCLVKARQNGIVSSVKALSSHVCFCKHIVTYW